MGRAVPTQAYLENPDPLLGYGPDQRRRCLFLGASALPNIPSIPNYPKFPNIPNVPGFPYGAPAQPPLPAAIPCDVMRRTGRFHRRSPLFDFPLLISLF